VACDAKFMIGDGHSLKGDVQVSVNALLSKAKDVDTKAIFRKTRYGGDLKKHGPKDGLLSETSLVRWPVSHIISPGSSSTFTRAVAYKPAPKMQDNADSEPELDEDYDL
jgi:hypothetical protein